MTNGCLAIIPARGGSKRVPGKNIRQFCGKPIIAYSIDAAIQSGLFDEVMVSTDDPITAKVGAELGAKVPFLRGASASDDNAGLVDVIGDVLNTYAQTGRQFEKICLILATAPFVSAPKLKEAFSLLLSSGADCVFPAVQFSYPIQRALIFNGNRIKMITPENYPKRSQDFIPTYHDAGQFYWMTVTAFQRKKCLFTDNTVAIVIPEKEAEDIDTEENFHLAEIKYLALSK
jgi:N-acylneuraminate cytidylyltransferase